MDDDKVAILFKHKEERQKKAKEEYKKESKERLKKIGQSKIRTAMIGALEVIEKNLQPYWEDDSEGARELKSIYEKMRQEILDKGNTQIRNFESELEQYDVEWLRYRMQIPVKPIQKGE